MAMSDFDDLLLARPELTRRRSLNASFLRAAMGRTKGQCTWCGGILKAANRRWHDECLGQFFERCHVTSAVARVWKRDRGTCRLCGRDILKCQRVWKSFQQRWEHDDHDKAVHELLGFARGRFAEVDHEIPVCEGGGLCRLDNLRLVCGQCHADETKKLAGRRKKKVI